MKPMRNIREEYNRIPCCPMLLRWPQTWTGGLPATFPSSCTRNFSKDVGRQSRSRYTHAMYSLCGSIKLHRIDEPVEMLSFHELEAYKVFIIEHLRVFERLACTFKMFRSMESSAESPVRPVIHVKSLSPTSCSTLSPPLSSSPLRYSDPLLKRYRNDLKFDVEDASDQEIAAYFSSRPPSEPMRLVTSSPHGHLPIGKISEKTSLESCGSSKEICTNTKTHCEQSLIIIAERLKPDKAQKIVRRLLRSLLQNLPLPDSSEEFSRHMIPDSTMLLLESETAHRSVSVQAFTVSTTVSVGDSSEITCRDGEREEMDPKKKLDRERWKGGIRALRESHLRLVMRQVHQLGHIERLGRSLKRYK